MKKTTPKAGWILFFFFSAIYQMTAGLSAEAMGPKGGGGSPPPVSGKAAIEKATIQMILKDPGKFGKKEVALEGAFHGWKGKCEESSPLTRSDWILKDETGCIYVSGEIPSWVSTIDPKGESLVVSGVMKIMEGRKPYFEAKEVTRK